MPFSRIINICTVGFLLVSCKPPGEQAAQVSREAEEAPDLVGYWQANCSFFPAQDAYKRYDVEFGSDASHTIVEMEYADETCVDGDTIGETVSTYSVGDHLGGGLWEIDLRSAVIDQQSYQIFAVEGERLYFGAISSDDATTTPDTRPQELNRQHFHTRQER